MHHYVAPVVKLLQGCSPFTHKRKRGRSRRIRNRNGRRLEGGGRGEDSISRCEGHPYSLGLEGLGVWPQGTEPLLSLPGRYGGPPAPPLGPVTEVGKGAGGQGPDEAVFTTYFARPTVHYESVLVEEQLWSEGDLDRQRRRRDVSPTPKPS